MDGRTAGEKMSIVPASMPGHLEFVENRCSKQVKKIVELNHNIIVELWFNKHYYERYYVGDERGKRVGIDPVAVESLVTRSVEHLFLYSSTVSGFNFSNKSKEKPTTRIILQEAIGESTLNVVIEVHTLSKKRFELTVITAMVIDEFKMIAGQYCIKVQHDHSVLKKLDNSKVLEICSFKFD